MIKRILPGLIAAAAIALGLALYLHIAGIQSAVNDDLKKSDQSAYMNFAEQAWESGYTYTGGRNRMPLVPWLQALFYWPELSDEAFFEQGKRLNVFISIACLGAIGTAFFLRFSALYALYAVLVIAYLFYAVKSPFFQAEILFYTLFAFAFVLSIDAIRSPRWYKAFGVGALLAAAHFTKASALPALGIFALSYSVKFFLALRSGNLDAMTAMNILWRAAAPVIVFSVLLFPYFNESKARYGHYLYNVNTTFYIWYDSWAEVKAGTRAAGDRVGWPNLPDEEIPSLEKYLSTHSFADILHRFSDSAKQSLSQSCTGKTSIYRFGNCGHAAIGSLILLVALASGLGRAGTATNLRQAQLIVYVTLVFLVYLLSSFWAWPLTRGPRLTFTLLIPLFWTIGMALELPRMQSAEIEIMKRKLNPWRVVYCVLIAIALFQANELAAYRAADLYGGK